MVRVRFVITMFLSICGTAWSSDYIRLGADSIQANSSNYDLVFYIERTCPTPQMIMGASNGFVMTATGNATWSFSGSPQDYFHQDAGSSVVWNLGGLLFTAADVNGISPDRFLTGGAALPPSGMPIITDEPYFHLILDIGSGLGKICIDSSYIAPAGPWKFSNLTCGQGGAADRPLIVSKNRDNSKHPICITVCQPPCDVTGPGDVSGIEDVAHPTALHQNYPNPFNLHTTIDFYLDRTADVNLQIFNLLGRRVRVIDLGYLGRGNHGTVWDGKDDTGRQLSSGMYIYRMNAGGHTQSKRMVLLK